MYAKLFASILDSSLWAADYPTRILFVTMIAMADREGNVYGSRSGLVRRAAIKPEELEPALATLIRPDAESSDLLRNPENEGRRIEEVAGGWRIVNFSYYRNLRDEDERREQNRIAQQSLRNRRKQNQLPSSLDADVSNGQPTSSKVSASQPPSATVSLSESEAEESKNKEETSLRSVEKKSRTMTVSNIRDEVEAFTLTDALYEWALLERGLDKPIVISETAKWQDWLRSNGFKAGKNALKDVTASWRGWMRRVDDPRSDPAKEQLAVGRVAEPPAIPLAEQVAAADAERARIHSERLKKWQIVKPLGIKWLDLDPKHAIPRGPWSHQHSAFMQQVGVSPDTYLSMKQEFEPHPETSPDRVGSTIVQKT